MRRNEVAGEKVGGVGGAKTEGARGGGFVRDQVRTCADVRSVGRGYARVSRCTIVSRTNSAECG